MKNFCKQPVWLLLTIIGLLLNSGSVNAQIEQQTDFITVNGVVKDNQNRRTLEYVNISVPGTNIGTVTNSDGGFTIKIPAERKNSVVEFSYLGYLNTSIPVNGQNISELTVWLTPNTNILEEVIIWGQDPLLLVEKAIDKIPDNYSKKHGMLTCFYRETAQKGQRYINISEAIIDVYKAPYSQQIWQDRVQIYKGRQLLSPKSGDTLIVKLQGGPNLSIFLDIVKNPDLILNREELFYYSFRMEESTMIDNRPQYVISFQPWMILPYALYRGRLYIDKERLAFTRAEFNLDMNDLDKATQTILRKKPFGLRFRPVEVSYLVNYKQQGETTYLSYIQNEVRFRCDWKRRLFSTNYTIMSEMVVTDLKEENVTNIPYRVSFKPSQSLSDKVADFADDDFWGEYNIIEPTESLESAVGRLRKGQR